MHLSIYLSITIPSIYLPLYYLSINIYLSTCIYLYLYIYIDLDLPAEARGHLPVTGARASFGGVATWPSHAPAQPPTVPPSRLPPRIHPPTLPPTVRHGGRRAAAVRAPRAERRNEILPAAPHETICQPLHTRPFRRPHSGRTGPLSEDHYDGHTQASTVAKSCHHRSPIYSLRSPSPHSDHHRREES